MIQYLLHTSLLVALLLGFYRLLLSGETFFGFHRWILLGGILLAFLLPLVSIPSYYSYRPEVLTPSFIEANTLSTAENKEAIYTKLAAKENQKMGIQNTEILPSLEENIPTSTVNEGTTVDAVSSTWLTRLSAISLSSWLFIIYGIGTGLLLLYLLYQIGMLIRFRKRGVVTKKGRYTIVEHDDCDQSFSFGRVIYIHKSADQKLDRNHIIRHEMIHARQLHTIDIIISEIMTIVLWFNPFAWMYKKAVRDNLEYLTDRQMLDEGADTKAYQLSLVRITVPHTMSQLRQPTAAVALANNYNHSTLKQRIIMMNKKYSSYTKVWRHLLIVPFLGLTMSFFNNVIAEQIPQERTEKATIDKSTDARPEPEEKIDSKSRSKTESRSKAKNKTKNKTKTKNVQVSDINIDLSSHINADVKAHTVIDITPNVTVDLDMSGMGEFMIATMSEALSNMDISAITEEAISSMPMYDEEGPVKGRWAIEDGCLHFWIGSKNNFSNWSECDYDLAGFKENADASFTMTREAGTMILNGDMDPNDGGGKFTFEPSTSFQDYLSGEDMGKIRDREMMFLFNTDINKNYIDFVRKEGFDLDRKSIVALAVHGVDDDEIKTGIASLKARKFKTTDIDDIISMTIHNVDSEYMDEIDALGYPMRKLDEYISMRIHDVDKDLVLSLKRAGYDDLTAKELVSMAIHDVNEGFINELARIGYKNLDVKTIVSLAIHDVDASFIEKVNEMGFDNIDLDDIMGFAIHDVDEDYIQALKDAGITDLDAQEITSFAIHDVDPEFVAFLESNGYSKLSNDEIVSAAIHDVDKRFINDLKDAGFTNLSFDRLISFAIHDVDSDYINEMSASGLADLSPDDLVSGKIHGVKASFVKDIMELGFDDVNMDDLIQLKIHDVRAKDIREMKENGGDKMDLDDYRRKIMRSKW